MSIKTSILGNLAATVVLSLIMVMKAAMGLMPQLNVIAMLSRMMSGPPILGWAAHLMIGIVVFGLAFALLNRFLPGKTAIAKGIAFAILAWAVMMIAVMPMAGAGLLGLQLGIMAPMMTLVLHVVYGAVLGAVVTWLGADVAATTAKA